mmetsp:Transcript_2214/g.3788  ORF Transcript_2214/g.3788 Transcript_2214/m.3788 type:complete len:89 (+) Transcript_2214:278-544(+)
MVPMELFPKTTWNAPGGMYQRLDRPPVVATLAAVRNCYANCQLREARTERQNGRRQQGVSRNLLKCLPGSVKCWNPTDGIARALQMPT